MSHNSLLFSQNPKKTQFAWCFPLYSSIPPCVFSLFGSQEATVTLNFFFFFFYWCWLTAGRQAEWKKLWRALPPSDVRAKQKCSCWNDSLSKGELTGQKCTRAYFPVGCKVINETMGKTVNQVFLFFLLAFAHALTSIRRRGKKTNLPVY